MHGVWCPTDRLSELAEGNGPSVSVFMLCMVGGTGQLWAHTGVVSPFKRNHLWYVGAMQLVPSL